jgi:hypothetical protein
MPFSAPTASIAASISRRCAIVWKHQFSELRRFTGKHHAVGQ